MKFCFDQGNIYKLHILCLFYADITYSVLSMFLLFILS